MPCDFDTWLLKGYLCESGDQLQLLWLANDCTPIWAMTSASTVTDGIMPPPPKQAMEPLMGNLQTTCMLLTNNVLTQALLSAGSKMDGDTPPKQRMVGWRGDLQTATSGTPANGWAGLSQEQEALLGALQVLALAKLMPACHPISTSLPVVH